MRKGSEQLNRVFALLGSPKKQRQQGPPCSPSAPQLRCCCCGATEAFKFEGGGLVDAMSSPAAQEPTSSRLGGAYNARAETPHLPSIDALALFSQGFEVLRYQRADDCVRCRKGHMQSRNTHANLPFFRDVGSESNRKKTPGRSASRSQATSSYRKFRLGLEAACIGGISLWTRLSPVVERISNSGMLRRTRRQKRGSFKGQSTFLQHGSLGAAIVACLTWLAASCSRTTNCSRLQRCCSLASAEP